MGALLVLPKAMWLVRHERAQCCRLWTLAFEEMFRLSMLHDNNMSAGTLSSSGSSSSSNTGSGSSAGSASDPAPAFAVLQEAATLLSKDCPSKKWQKAMLAALVASACLPSADIVQFVLQSVVSTFRDEPSELHAATLLSLEHGHKQLARQL